NVDNLDDSIMNEAATKIQSAYRGYRARSLLSSNKFPIHSSNSDVLQKRCYHLSESSNDKWKLFQRVQIDDWPPIPDPKNLPSELDVRLGTLPKGYTVTAANSGGRSKVKRYVPLPEHVDPNLGMCGHICNVYKKTKKILGLRKVEHLPSFARDMLTVTTLQDDSLPVVLVMGGLQPKEPVNLSYGKLIMRYSPLKDRWEYFGVLPEPRNYHAAVYYREHIYVTGGCDPDKRNCGEMVATNTTYCLNIHSSEWVQKSEMQCTRSHHGLVAFQGKLYAIGGRDNNGRLVASVEVYDIENDKWTLKRAMSHPRMGMACVAYQESIWCVGGIGLSDSSDPTSVSYPVLSSVISYDVGKDSWISRPPLRRPRAYASCVAVNNQLWLVGGANKDRTHNALISIASVDKYYPDEAQWMRRTLLNIPRHSAAVVAVESCVYVFGGVSSQGWSAVAKNEMVVLNDISLHGCSSLPLPLTGLAAVCVPPVSPSLRAESIAMLLHAQLTFH
ncbi:Alpha-scruin, partial [Araneus ventricosus]